MGDLTYSFPASRIPSAARKTSVQHLNCLCYVSLHFHSQSLYSLILGSALWLWSYNLLWPLLTPLNSSHHLSMTIVQDNFRGLPGYYAPTFTLMPAVFTSMPSVQVLDFEVNCLLIRHVRLLYDFCSSGQRFACGFLQISPHGEHPCRPANSSPCRVCSGLSPPSECALPGAQ